MADESERAHLVDQRTRYLQTRVSWEAEGEQELMIGQLQACEWVKVWRKTGVRVQRKVVVRL